MQLFINEEVWNINRWYTRNLTVKNILDSRNVKDGRSCITFRSLVDDGINFEKVSIILPKECKQRINRKENILVDNVKLKVKNEQYEFVKSESSHENGIYALLYSDISAFDDIYIERKMKNTIQVIKRIRCINDEIDAGSYISNIYLIKIQLNENESLPLYLTSVHPYALQKQLIFYKMDIGKKDEKVMKCQTYIILNDCNKEEYMSLSDL